MNVVFMGTPDFASRILERVLRGPHPVVGVVCQPDRVRGRRREPQPPPVKTLALDHGLPLYQPRSLRRRFIEWLDARHADVILVAAYGRLLPTPVLEHPRLGCLNVHPSLLPRYRGPAPIQWALANGDAQTGVTIMQMDGGMDTGDILRQIKVPLGREDTGDILHDRLADLGAELLLGTLDALESGPLDAVPQDQALASHAPMLTRESGRVDWTMAASRIEPRVRGFHPWPGSWTRFRGKILKLFPPTTVERLDRDQTPGTILGLDPDRGLGVACGEGALRLKKVQQEGKKPMTAADFFNGARLKPGEAFTE